MPQGQESQLNQEKLKRKVTKVRQSQVKGIFDKKTQYIRQNLKKRSDFV